MTILSDFSIASVKNLSAVLADKLSDMIEAGIFKPGEHLVQTDLAERFGVSRVAIRDALQQLLQRGVAVNVPRKGIIVRPVSPKTVMDLFNVRRLLESEAVRLAAQRMSDKDLDELEQIIKEQEVLGQKQDLARCIEKDWEFHKTLYDHCDNDPLKEMIAHLWSRTRQARGIAQSNLKWGTHWSVVSSERHSRVVMALRKRDGNEAARLVAENIEVAAEELAAGLIEIETSENDLAQGEEDLPSREESRKEVNSDQIIHLL